MITISIDVTLLDKARFKEVTRQNGNLAKFCDLVLIETPDSSFGDYAIKRDCTREEREKGVKMPFVGNGKIRGGSKPQGEPAARPKPAPPQKRPSADPDLDAPEDDIF